MASVDAVEFPNALVELSGAWTPEELVLSVVVCPSEAELPWEVWPVLVVFALEAWPVEEVCDEAYMFVVEYPDALVACRVLQEQQREQQVVGSTSNQTSTGEEYYSEKNESKILGISC